MMKLYRKKTHGISLLEVMLSLLVIASIIFIVLRYAGPARTQTQITEAIRQINTLSDASFRYLEGQPNLTNVTIKALADKGFIPSRYDSKNLEAYNNPWRNPVTIGPFGGDANQLQITSQVPTEAVCKALLARVLNFALKSATNCSSGAPATLTVVIGSP